MGYAPDNARTKVHLMPLQVRRLGYALGAEISGLDLARPLDAAAVARVRELWLQHIVLCFRGQDLTPPALMGFAAQFGELDDNSWTRSLRHAGHDEVVILETKPAIGKHAANIAEKRVWHTDLSFSPRPASATFLHAKQLPTVGGDTMFANQYMAYEALSLALRETLSPLAAVHDITLGGASSELKAEMRERTPPTAHPIVREHPETGRKALYVGERVSHIQGMTEEESLPILRFLQQHSTRYEFVYRHRWQTGDVLMWDNRCAVHYAVGDYGEVRRMERCSLRGQTTNVREPLNV